MKIFYWSNGWNNFGDELNPWLVPKLLPQIEFNEDESEYYVGVGTLLNRRLPERGMKYVLGAGVGYGDAPLLDESYRVYGVRGPLSARALGLDEARFGLSDPAMLLPEVFTGDIVRTGRVAYMPHCHSESRADWEELAKSIGIDYISPTESVDVVVRKIAGASLVVTEALHGAIVADAFRVPWIPVTASERIFEFKWEDWMASIGMKYQPHCVHALVDGKGLSWLARRKDEVKRMAIALGLDASTWTPPGKPFSSVRDFDEVRICLANLASGEQAVLSTDDACLAAKNRLLEANDRFQRDYLAERA